MRQNRRNLDVREEKKERRLDENRPRRVEWTDRSFGQHGLGARIKHIDILWAQRLIVARVYFCCTSRRKFHIHRRYTNFCIIAKRTRHEGVEQNESANLAHTILKGKDNSPQCSSSLDDDLFLRVGEPANQRADDVFSLQETPCGRVVIDQV